MKINHTTVVRRESQIDTRGAKRRVTEMLKQTTNKIMLRKIHWKLG